MAIQEGDEGFSPTDSVGEYVDDLFRQGFFRRRSHNAPSEEESLLTPEQREFQDAFLINLLNRRFRLSEGSTLTERGEALWRDFPTLIRESAVSERRKGSESHARVIEWLTLESVAAFFDRTNEEWERKALHAYDTPEYKKVRETADVYECFRQITQVAWRLEQARPRP